MEKQKLIPQLRFPDFEGDWNAKVLKDIGSTYNGLTGKTKVDFGKGKPYIQYKQIFDDSKIDVSRFDYVEIKPNERQNKAIFGDAFFTVSSETPDEIGTASILLDEVKELYLNSFCFGYRVSAEVLSPYFSRYLFRSCSFRDDVVKLAQGITRYNMSKNEFLKININIPPLPEQQKIASFFTVIVKKLSQLKRKKTLLEQYKKGVLKKIFTQKIRFKDDKGQEFPKWEQKTLGDIAEKKQKKNKANLLKNVLTNSASLGIVNQRDFFDKDIANQNNLFNYYIVEKDDFIYNPRISNFAPVGPISRNHIGLGVMSPLYSVFSLKKGVFDFFEKYFSTTQWHWYMKSIANYGARFDRMNITTNDFYNMPLPFPCIAEQTKIANFLSAIDDKIKQAQKQIEKTEVWKKGLMQKMFV
jgi:type I restriction enzyme S subunit